MPELLRFALPALGISLAGPILSNIDNAFVGRLCGPAQLAALSPGSVVADYILYLVVFLPRATVGLVSRAAAKSVKAAQAELVRALSVAMPLGVALSLVYITCTEPLLRLLRVSPELLPYAAVYARIRGAMTWATLAQSVCLSALLANKDSVTPLKVVAIEALANICGDFLLCAWPCHLGVAGAALATSFATWLSFVLMLRALRKTELLPKKWIRLPESAAYLAPLLEYAGPLLLVLLSRFLTLSAMALYAASLGTTALAAYQVLINLYTLFGLFGEPLSQAAQAMLPPLLEKKDVRGARRAMRSLLLLGLLFGLGAGSLAAMGALSGGLFSADPEVLQMLKSLAPVLLLTVTALVFEYPVDGAMLATKNFKTLVALDVAGVMVQLPVMHAIAHNLKGQPGALSWLMLTMYFRLAMLSVFCLARLWPSLLSRKLEVEKAAE
ncbi:unnamed protein product [Effrenium voratum]|uniref:Multidrug resistance protein NorM n=1 Tax=Effrenium voratum TaxID=2562239 RepID=A0AA36MSQ8_9DINO|nr:unnamed protein product [Effrenium voratum]CAJ1424995.1 unnamed protein product [Effrenium voratum]